MSNYFEKMLGVVSPAYGALTGEGAFGNLLGKKGEKKDEAQKVLQDAADQKAAQEQEAAAANAQQWVNKQNGMKKGGVVKKSSASSRADGIAQRGKTRGVMVACGGGMMKK